MGKSVPFIQRPQLLNPKGLDRWRVALGTAAYSVPTIWCVGHSIVQGAGIPSGSTVNDDDVADYEAWAGRLRTRFARHFNTNEAGFIQAKAVQADARVVLANTGNTSGGFTQAKTINSTGPGTITTALPACTNADIIYYDGDGTNGQPTGGNFSKNFDAAGASTVSHAAGGGYKVSTTTGLADATHSLVITGTTANSCIICGVRYYSSRGVAVGRFGRGGYNTQDFLGLGANNPGATAAQQARNLASFGMGSPALVIIELLTNDWGDQVTAGSLTIPSLYKTNIQSFADTAIAAGASVLLLSDTDPPYANPVGGTYNWSDYDNALRQVASATAHCAYASIADMFGPSANAITLGFQNSNSVHPKKAGHSDIGDKVFELLTRRFQPLT